MSKLSVTETLVEIEQNSMDLETLEAVIQKIKSEKQNFFNVKMIPHADYDGIVYVITFLGDRLETDKEESSRKDIANRISMAWKEHDERNKK